MPPRKGYGEYRSPCIEASLFGARPQGVCAPLGPLMFGSPTVAPLARQSEPKSA
jgi:hypothetical protein